MILIAIAAGVFIVGLITTDIINALCEDGELHPECFEDSFR